MGNRINPSCLLPQYDDKNELYNSDHKIINNPIDKYKNNNYFTNKSYKNDNKNNYLNKNSKAYIDKVKILQKYVRFCLSIKKFNERIDLLTNILELDSSVNIIRDKKIENNILKNNIGEQICQQLINTKNIVPYKCTRYYRLHIKKYKPNRYLKEIPLTYIDKYKNNDLYIGTWTLEKIFNGYGVFYSSGNKYEGFWNFGKLSGEARKFCHNKDYYIGEFVNGQSNGYGKYYHSDGTIYEGNWLNDYPHGTGKENFNDGSKFVGIFENGHKKKGKFTWIDGSFYDGEIKNNYFEGYGKFKWKEGRIYEGFWKNGKMNGKGSMIYIDGAKYEGEFIDGKRHGKGDYYWNENKYYKGNWVKGKQEGEGYYYNNGKGILGVWKDGKMKHCLFQEINNELLNSKINEEKPVPSSEKYAKTMSCKNDCYYDSINISTNLSNNSMRDFKKNNSNSNNTTTKKYQYNKIENKKKAKNNNINHNKNSINDFSIITDYSCNKSKITNIDVLFKTNPHSSRSKKSVISKYIDTTNYKFGNAYKKYKKKK
jgi:hypothetical protein